MNRDTRTVRDDEHTGYHVRIDVEPYSDSQTNIAATITSTDGQVVYAQWGQPGSGWGPTPLGNNNVNVVAMLKAISQQISSIAALPGDVAGGES